MTYIVKYDSRRSRLARPNEPFVFNMPHSAQVVALYDGLIWAVEQAGAYSQDKRTFIVVGAGEQVPPGRWQFCCIETRPGGGLLFLFEDVGERM